MTKSAVRSEGPVIHTLLALPARRRRHEGLAEIGGLV